VWILSGVVLLPHALFCFALVAQRYLPWSPFDQTLERAWCVVWWRECCVQAADPPSVSVLLAVGIACADMCVVFVGSLDGCLLCTPKLANMDVRLPLLVEHGLVLTAAACRACLFVCWYSFV
jgi:hypothetical protein